MKQSIGKAVGVRNKKGDYLGLVDRTGENLPFDKIIYVRLPCGFSSTFFQVGLSDREYIRRTKYFKKNKI